MDAFGVLNDVLGDYENFVKGFLNIKDDQIRSKVEKEIANGLLWPEPWLALNPAFESGGTVSDLVDRGVLHPEAVEHLPGTNRARPVGTEIAFHRHQTDAFEIANRRESYVLTTGTGSGKSMAYIVPIVDRVLREGSGKGVRAIVVYPMNALANSQRDELEKFLGKTNPKVSFARYTGQENREEREAILANPPDILLTNYVMLELMLTRPKERDGPDQQRREPVLPGSRRAAHLPRPAGRRRGDAGPPAARRRQVERRAVHRYQRDARRSRHQGRAAPAGRRIGDADVRRRDPRSQHRRGNPATRHDGRGRPGRADGTARQHRRRPTWEELQADPLAVWIEQHFGLREDDEGKLARQPAVQAQRCRHEAARRDRRGRGGLPSRALQELLLAGSRARDAAGPLAVRVQAAPVHRQGRHRLRHPGTARRSAT